MIVVVTTKSSTCGSLFIFVGQTNKQLSRAIVLDKSLCIKIPDYWIYLLRDICEIDIATPLER